MRRSLLQLACFTMVSIWIAYVYLYNRIESVNTLTQVAVSSEFALGLKPPLLLEYVDNQTVDSRILILARSKHSLSVLELVRIFEVNRYKYKIVEDETVHVKLKSSRSNRSFYSLVIVDSLSHISESIVEHCRRFRIGIIYIKSELSARKMIEPGESCHLSYFKKDFLKITRPVRNESVIVESRDTMEVEVYSQSRHLVPVVTCNGAAPMLLKTREEATRLRQVLVGCQLGKLIPGLVLDILQYASYGRVHFDSERFVQIDVDDVFVARSGLRMRTDDVDEMIRFQKLVNLEFFNSSAHQFKFNLGFSGFYFSTGSGEENAADRLLIGKHADFSNEYIHSD